MTQEEKNLLLKDLCSRLPYGIWLSIKDTFKHSIFPYSNVCIEPCTFQNLYDGLKESVKDKTLQKIIKERSEYLEIKPYLRTMSSMTEEEVKEFAALESIDVLGGDIKITCVELSIDAIDWLNKKMFDYRGLISKGLALEAHKGMYKID